MWRRSFNEIFPRLREEKWVHLLDRLITLFVKVKVDNKTEKRNILNISE